MKFIIAACLAAAPLATGQGGYIQEFFNARKVEATDPLAAKQLQTSLNNLGFDEGSSKLSSSKFADF